MKELVLDFKKCGGVHTQFSTIDTEVGTFKFLDVNIINNLLWTYHIEARAKKHTMSLLPKETKEICMSPTILINIYQCAVESNYTIRLHHSFIWEQLSRKHKITRVVDVAQLITKTRLASIDSHLHHFARGEQPT